MTASVVDMTGRVLEPGETVTETADEQATMAAYRRVWDDVPGIVREIAESEDLFYPHVAETVVHSLLQEASQASDKHESAREVLECIRRRFYPSADPCDSSESS